ncbi:phenoloxidase-activating factor 2-like isoform X4 [Stegodyphus dumicola]|uniref:phenoloxidase-activating factor 2-like isoform X4 n=1 Tax=Stegodyphus dumicola TaxID=202533 RepID=UPI0015AC9E47|nr:phenoloxidase-activating factor 2-like isoform X4 [Stegodyphus dumicola]
MKGTFCAMLMLPKVTERNRIFATILWVLITGRELLITTVVADRSHCDCMDYWECIGSGGTPYAYCSYSSQVCCFVEPSAVSVGILPRRKKSGSCGIKGPNKGRDGVTDPGEWAWHAAVLETPQDLYICGASLLDEYWILTAAHCVYEYSLPNALKIRLGEYDVSTTSEPLKYEEYTASRIVVHPNFDNRTLLHDIALVRLTRPAKRKANINVVCMPPEGTTNNELVSSARCFVTGWGKSTESVQTLPIHISASSCSTASSASQDVWPRSSANFSTVEWDSSDCNFLFKLLCNIPKSNRILFETSISIKRNLDI